jgi:galactose mutarotase-like enzyme
MGTVELLYRGGDFADALTGGGMSPVLFPVVGRLRLGEAQSVYVHEGKRYDMDTHGFAKDMEWHRVVADADVDSRGAFVRAYLSDSDETRRAYPFAFEYALTYRLLEGALHIEVEVESEGPFSVGFHPYFNTPFAPGMGTKADCALRLPVRKYWVLENLVPTGEVRELEEVYDLPEGVCCSQLDLDQVFTDLVTNQRGTHRSSLWDRASGIRVDVESTLDPFSEIVVYAPRSEAYVCIENWTGPPNILNQEETWSGLPPSALRASIRIKPSRFGVCGARVSGSANGFSRPPPQGTVSR